MKNFPSTLITVGSPFSHPSSKFPPPTELLHLSSTAQEIRNCSDDLWHLSDYHTNSSLSSHLTAVVESFVPPAGELVLNDRFIHLLYISIYNRKVRQLRKSNDLNELGWWCEICSEIFVFNIRVQLVSKSSMILNWFSLGWTSFIHSALVKSLHHKSTSTVIISNRPKPAEWSKKN